MRLWSKGLGKLILPFDIGKAESVKISDNSILIEGRIIEKKVNWPYKLNLFLEDMLIFTRFMAYSNTVLYFIKSQTGLRFIFFVIVRFAKLIFIIPIALFETIIEILSGRDKALLHQQKEIQKNNQEEV